MKRLCLVVATLLLFAATALAQQNPWQRLSGVRSKSTVLKNKRTLVQPKLFELNLTSLRSSLVGAPKRNGRITSARMLSFPNEKGEMDNFSIVESSNMDPVLAAKYPDIRSYVGRGVKDPTQTVYFSVSPLGLQSMLIQPDRRTVFIEPYTNDHETYVIYTGSDQEKSLTPFECRVAETSKKNLGLNAVVANRPNADDGLMRTYRLALSCTGEYARYFGGTVVFALAAMNASLTRVNGIFETDFGVHMNMIANNDRLIYLDSATDPYTSDVRLAFSDFRWITEVSNTLTSVIGNAAYDVGHLFAGSGNGGAAGYRSVCHGSPTDPNTGTSAGFTGSENPEGIKFDVQLASHEFGHQFGASHVFSFAPESLWTQVEPAFGTSIMSYNYGIPQVDGQPDYGTYFNAVSIGEVMDFIKVATCATSIPTGNAIPTANAGPDYTIPKSTAFMLRGTSTDANADPLTYNWEQQDGETEGTPNPAVTSTSGPAFSSLSPGPFPYRSFPSLPTVLTGAVASMWEVVPSVARLMNFRFTVRDNHPGGPANNSDDMVVTTSGTAGPFVITAPNTAVTWPMGSTQTISWNVAGTTAVPVSCANVKISLSVDGGLTFPTVLLASTPDDGSQSITIPNSPSASARIKVEAVGNIFYDISNVNFYISNTGTYNITSSGWPFGYGTITPEGVIPVVGGSSKTFTITHCATCEVNDVVVDGVSKGAITTYTFTNVTAPHSIDATFRNLGCGGLAGPPITGQTSNLCNGKTFIYRCSIVETANSYNWTIPSGFTLLSGQGTTTVTIKTPVTFNTAELKVNAISSCGISAPTSVTLNGAPGDLSAQMSGPSQVVTGSVNVYSLPSTPGLSYTWIADGSSVVGGWGTNNASIKAGSINGFVKATVKNNCGTGPVAKKSFTVQPGGSCIPPTLSAVVTNANCSGAKTGAINLTAASGSSPYTYKWTGPNSFVSTAEDLSALGAGTYAVTVTATGGCTKTATYFITQPTSVPAPAAITGEASNLCGIKVANFNASLVAGATSYNWTVPSGFRLLSVQGDISAAIVTPPSFTTAVLKVSATSSCGTSPQTSLTLTGAPGDLSAQITGPSEVVTGSVNVYSLPSNLGLSYYSWLADGSSVVGGWGTNSASIKAGAINGYVKVTVKNACGTAPVAHKYFSIQSAALKVNSANSEIDLSASSFRAYPNPVQDLATVVFNAEKKDAQYELRVIDIYGQVLIAKKGMTNPGVNTMQIRLGRYAKGIYMVTLVMDNKIRSQKLFKSN
ncbi:MAG TPA: zinc-dependent metalloprotease family protein [Chryseolinea sp.]|nr:zinc-dependent metalloprotease family protein [Chryseolinea sp.]